MKARILLVEDDDDNRRMMSILLTKSDFSVTAVVNKSGAVEACKEESFDLCITDIGLTDGSGIDLMKEVLEKCNIPGIVVSGHGMVEAIAVAKEAGFVEYIVKPVNFQSLLSAIDRSLNLAKPDRLNPELSSSHPPHHPDAA